MIPSLVFLTDTDVARCLTIRTIIQRIPGVHVETFETLALTRRAMRTDIPHLMIGPWSEGGETMLAARATVAGNAACTPVPIALVLTDTVSSSRISLTRQAGNAELIPCDPLDEAGLFNRSTLLLRGADALYDALGRHRGPAWDTALENLPALKRRLAA